jgi:hypothetical protein
VADDDKSGSNWSDAENDAIVADYFSMLADEIAGRSYVKAQHNSALHDLIGRSRGAIERKHQNISAVLIEFGLPWILGYKPYRNFQGSLIGAIDRHLSANRTLLYEQPEPRVPLANEEAAPAFVAMPQVPPQIEKPPILIRAIRKFDPVERDFRNRALGRAGEEFVLGFERKRLTALERPDLAGKVTWVSEDQGDGAGFDILSYEPSGAQRLIEVKTTNGAAATPFFLTRNEYEVAAERQKDWHLYRVHLFAQTPSIFTVRPPLDETLSLTPQSWRASVR